MVESNIRWAIRRIAEIIKNPTKRRDIYMTLEWKAGYMEDTFIKQDYAWLAERLKPNSVVLDLGGAIGDSAVYFAGFENVSKVISLEPVPKVYAIGKKMVAESPRRVRNKIRFENCAISDKEGIKAIDGWLGWAFSTRKDKQRGVSVRQHTLDSITKDITNPIAIKCDIEGDERIIFNDADLSKVYVIELEHHWNCKELMKSILKDKGFKTKDLTPMNDMGCALMGAWRE